MPGTTKRTTKYVELKTPRLKKPYNRFEVQYTVTETADGAGKTKYVYSGGSLVCPELLGLNIDWLHNHSAPLDQAASQEDKLRIRELHLKFPYWGHLIDNSIQKFNASNTRRCRKLVYDLRHGEADHNAWKRVFNKVEWTEVKRDPINSRVETRAYLKQYPEYKRQPIIEYRGKKYCLIDPPLTANGEDQAKRANDIFRFLRNYMFPMPKRAYVSPLHRAMQTFNHGLNNIGIGPEDSYILDALREKQTGNCADILIDEYTRRDNPKRPPKAGTGAPGWETDVAVQKRAASLHKRICELDDSDCIVRVTHSLLIQNNLIGLEGCGDAVLKTFMLAEGKIFAYVIEGDRPIEETARRLRNHGFKTVRDRWNEVGRRRKSAFPDLKASTTPTAVPIEPAILAI